jgi:hypothetical protein
MALVLSLLTPAECPGGSPALQLRRPDTNVLCGVILTPG